MEGGKAMKTSASGVWKRRTSTSPKNLDGRRSGSRDEAFDGKDAPRSLRQVPSNPNLFESPLPPKAKTLTSDNPIHKAQDSLFSTSSGYTNYRGFFNLAIILLVLSNARVALENIIKYGILVDPDRWLGWLLSEKRRYIIFLALMVKINVYAMIALFTERSLASGRINNRQGVIIHMTNLFILLVAPALISVYTNLSPFSSCFCLGIYSIVFLKLISYAQVNYWCRKAVIQAFLSRSHSRPNGTDPASGKTDLKTPLIKYPDNLTPENMYFFLCAPTLCYELNFPRSPRIRKSFLVKRFFEVILISQLILALAQQWMVPLLNNSVSPFIEMDYGRMTERLLKLAVPNHLIWLLFFYWLFHSVLNVAAELLRFSDREFYRDWWNSETIQYFWQAWNIPVHRWCHRHLYKPMLRAGFGRMSGAVAVFMFSAFFHEYVISVPLQMFRLWAFSGMLAQIPLNFLTLKVLRGKAGNVVVWLSLIVGQPLAILMYLHDYYVLYFSPNFNPEHRL